MSDFPCTRCGVCCEMAGHHPRFPLRVDPDGVCSRFDRATRLCTVYEDRPHVCRVADTRPEGMDEAEWYALNAAACEALAGMARQ